jgi:magnesium transporter
MRDVYEDLIHLLDTEEILRENLSSNISIHLNAVSNNLNEIMKMLTAVASFVMVPTLIAGIYGMNFKFFPEINQIWGYPFALGLMGLSVVIMYSYFRKRGWF